MFAFGSKRDSMARHSKLSRAIVPFAPAAISRRGVRVLPEPAGQKLGSRVATIAFTRPKACSVRAHLRFRAAYSAARYAASAAMSSAVIAFIRSDMPGLLPRAPLRKSSIVLSR